MAPGLTELRWVALTGWLTKARSDVSWARWRPPVAASRELCWVPAQGPQARAAWRLGSERVPAKRGSHGALGRSHRPGLANPRASFLWHSAAPPVTEASAIQGRGLHSSSRWTVTAMKERHRWGHPWETESAGSPSYRSSGSDAPGVLLAVDIPP